MAANPRPFVYGRNSVGGIMDLGISNLAPRHSIQRPQPPKSKYQFRAEGFCSRAEADLRNVGSNPKADWGMDSDDILGWLKLGI